MKFYPARGYVFVIPVDEIPAAKIEAAGFGGTTEKHKHEQPYKFRVVSVGGPRPFDGMMIGSEVREQNIVSLSLTNFSVREQRETAGFLVDGVWHLPVDFREILGIWE